MCWQILVRGSKATTDSLSEYCRSNIPQVNVFVPHLNEMLDATTDSHIYQVLLFLVICRFFCFLDSLIWNTIHTRDYCKGGWFQEGHVASKTCHAKRHKVSWSVTPSQSLCGHQHSLTWVHCFLYVGQVTWGITGKESVICHLAHLQLCLPSRPTFKR